MDGDERYDVIIVGGGPAGLTAAIYGSRGNKNVLMLERMLPGGMMNNTYEIENYPGFKDPISGAELSRAMTDQALRFGTTIKTAEVEAITKNGELDFNVETKRGDIYKSKGVIITTGVKRRQYRVPGHDELEGRGISYCATCDGPLYRGKDVAVIGGGDSAVEEALFLTQFANKVYIIHRRDELRADPGLASRALKNKKIDILWNSVVTEFKGTQVLDGITVQDVKTEESIPLDVEGVFVFIGFLAESEFIKVPVARNRLGFIRTKRTMETKTPGLFVAGDLRANPFKQIAVAVGEGATAARGFEMYVDQFEHPENEDQVKMTSR